MDTKWSADRSTTSSVAGLTPKDFAMTTKLYLDSETTGMETSFVMDGDAFDMAMSIVDNGDDTMSMNTCGQLAERNGMIDFDMNMGVQMKDEEDDSHSEVNNCVLSHVTAYICGRHSSKEILNMLILMFAVDVGLVPALMSFCES